MKTAKNNAMTSIKRSFSWRRFTHRDGLLLGYLLLLLLPFVVAQTLEVKFENIYRWLLSAVTLVAMMAFFIQFPLAGRMKQIPFFANIDWSVAKHKQVGKYLGVFFFCHPFLILAPKLFVSFEDFTAGLITMITSESLLTALIAWGVMLIWVLSAIYKDTLSIRYETWRLLHLVGFIIILTLATLHITTVGTHGQFNQQFNNLWWCLYVGVTGVLIYNYGVKPKSIKGQPFTIRAIKKISACDWQLCIESTAQQKFDFEAGQFAWLNTSESAYNLEQHPFSIAVEENNQSQLSFIIRELGDYTRRLGELKIGQRVFVDGPYGSMSLSHAKHATGITLIAGGVGIAPMLSLLRQLAKDNDARPIRLLYANKSMARMVCLDELVRLEASMIDFTVQLFTDHQEQVQGQYSAYLQHGFITQTDIESTLNEGATGEWEVYLCGPQSMMQATTKKIKQIGITASHIHFEQLSF